MISGAICSHVLGTEKRRLNTNSSHTGKRDKLDDESLAFYAFSTLPFKLSHRDYHRPGHLF